jgi:DNA-binding MarR family transcriptional regulator
MPTSPRSTSPDPASQAPLSPEAFEISRLLLELLHAAGGDRGGSRSAHGTPGVETPAPTPLTPHAVRAGVHLYEHGRLTIGQLAANLGVSYGWASRVVSELVNTGMAVRSPDPDDRRIVYVSMAPEARARVEASYRWRSEAIERALGTLDPSARALVIDFLRRTVHELAQTRNP